MEAARPQRPWEVVVEVPWRAMPGKGSNELHALGNENDHREPADSFDRQAAPLSVKHHGRETVKREEA